MKWGDISNEPVPKVGIRFEEILRREKDGVLNRSGKAFVENLAHLDFEIVLLTTDGERRAKTYCYKWGIPYSKILAVDTILDLENVCRELGMVTYYDTDKDLLQRIKQRGKEPIELILWTLLDNYYLE